MFFPLQNHLLASLIRFPNPILVWRTSLLSETRRRWRVTSRPTVVAPLVLIPPARGPSPPIYREHHRAILYLHHSSISSPLHHNLSQPPVRSPACLPPSSSQHPEPPVL